MILNQRSHICDFKELKSGCRREGMYSAMFGFVYKSAIGINVLLSSSLLALTGCDTKNKTVPVEALTSARLAYMNIPCVGLALAIRSLVFYPLTKKLVLEI